MKVYVVNRTCSGEDYGGEFSSHNEIFANENDAEKRAREILREEAEYLGLTGEDYDDFVNCGLDSDYAEYVDVGNDYRVEISIVEYEVK